MTAFYNEIDPFAAEWLRELIKAGAIAPGIVDERSIEDIAPDELDRFTQCHFFAGIGVWSYALRQSGWSDDRPVWSGSCPCQPFSAAGKRKAEKDERHLWPAWFSLIKNCKPKVIFGEQVASSEIVGTQLEIDFAIAVREGEFARANKIARKLVKTNGFHFAPRWLDALCGDLEEENYSVRPGVFGAHSVGAPHIRKRLYFAAERLADSDQHRCDQGRISITKAGDDGIIGNSSTGGLADSKSSRRRIFYAEDFRSANAQVDPPANPDHCKLYKEQRLAPSCPGPTNGFWRDVDWLFCRDGKWRPVEPEIFPLAPRTPQHVGMLRGAGNAINAEAAKAFITAFMEAA